MMLLIDASCLGDMPCCFWAMYAEFLRLNFTLMSSLTPVEYCFCWDSFSFANEGILDLIGPRICRDIGLGSGIRG